MKIIDRIYEYVNQYTRMNIEGVIIHCPYWQNKMEKGKVVLRGYLNGKASAEEIKRELVKRLRNRTDQDSVLNFLYIQKFAKRERIGIDCSGLAYRVLNEFAGLKYKKTSLSDLSSIFKEGINRTNAKTLTSSDYCYKIDRISEAKPGDLIRMMSGRHVAVVLEVNKSQVKYVHSSCLTKTKGVHFGIIKIDCINKSLNHQRWLEKTGRGNNFSKKYFHEDKGDGVYRLKIFI